MARAIPRRADPTAAFRHVRPDGNRPGVGGTADPRRRPVWRAPPAWTTGPAATGADCPLATTVRTRPLSQSRRDDGRVSQIGSMAAPVVANVRRMYRQRPLAYLLGVEGL